MTRRLFQSLIAAIWLLVGLPGCSGSGAPRVEAWIDGGFQPLAHQSYQIAGKRDGSTTRAVATFTLADGARLDVELDIVYDPTPSLGGGRWQIDGDRPASGTVRAEAVKFLGGQGQGPSLGGRFLLEAEGAPRFRVVLPARPVEAAEWKGS